MADGGFVLGFTAGYEIAITDIADGDYFDSEIFTKQEIEDLEDGLN